MIGVSCTNLKETKNTEVTVEGMYIYFADSAMLFPCDGSERIFLRGGELNAQLESLYSETRNDFGEKVFVKLKGDLEVQDKMEGIGKERVLKVNTIVEVTSEKNCN